MKKTFVFEELVKPMGVESKDGGRGLIYEIQSPQDSGLFVRLHSWAEPIEAEPHADFNFLVGKRVRITIEVVEEPSKGGIAKVRAENGRSS